MPANDSLSISPGKILMKNEKIGGLIEAAVMSIKVMCN
jgi:hypothetical protein